jgi:thiamine pyrophosphokinase
MSKSFLFTNSLCSEGIKYLITPDDYIIGVDGGINTLEIINLVPHIIIGDFDSVKQNNVFLTQNIQQITHPPEKDFTDTELAVNYAIEEKFSAIIIVNNMQDRIDHVLGVMASLRYLHRLNIPSLILGDKQLFIILKNKNSFYLPMNTTVSLIPLSDSAQGITTKGLYYRLIDEQLTSDRARGVSNLVTNEHIEITVNSGDLLLIINFNKFADIKKIIDSL